MRWPIGSAQEDASAIDRLPGQWQNINPFNNFYTIPGASAPSYHTGVDLVLHSPAFGSGIDAPIYAVADGRVIFSGIGGGSWGWIIDIAHKTKSGQAFVARYAHGDHIKFSQERVIPKAGDLVTEGQEIILEGNADGYYGSSYHLHFDVSLTDILLTTPNEWPGQNDALLLANYVDPIAFIISEKQKEARMVALHNAVLKSSSNLIPVLDSSGTFQYFLPPESPVILDSDPLDSIKVRGLTLLPLKDGGYIYNGDAVIGSIYTPPAPRVIQKQVTATDGLLVRSDKYHTATATGAKVTAPQLIYILDDGGTSSVDAGHSYTYFAMTDAQGNILGYIAGVIDGISWLRDVQTPAINVLQGFDSSDANTWQANVDLSGVDFVNLKGGQGVKKDDVYDATYAIAQAQHKPIITWWFLNAPSIHSIAEQASACVATVHPSGIAVDYENNTDGTIPTIPQLIEFLNALMTATGLTKLLIYTRTNLLPDNPPPELTKHDLWLPITSPVPGGWSASQVKFIQYAQGNVAGVGGPFDLDQFTGNVPDLNAYIASITPKPIAAVIPGARILGINTDPRNPAANPTAAQLGNVAWVRFVLNVYRPDNTKQSLSDTFAYYDPIIDSLRAAGINICLVLNHQTFNDGYPAWVPTTWSQYAQAFAAACGQIADHYRGRVAKYEVWNEPDNPDPKSSGMAAPNFGLICRAAIPAIRQADVGAKVVSGGLMSDDPMAYLSTTGGLGNPDEIGFHPYTLTGQPLINKIVSLRTYGPVSITEDGFPQGNLTAAAQVISANYQTAVVSNCGMFCWFGWSDRQDARTVGLVDANGQPNGALWTAWQALIAQDSQNNAQKPPSSADGNSGTNGSQPSPFAPPVPVPSPKPSVPGELRRLLGIGLYDPDRTGNFKADFIGMCTRLKNAGKPLAGVIVMDDIDAANQLVSLVDHVVYRDFVKEEAWHIEDSWTLDQVNKYAEDLFTGYALLRSQLDTRVIIEVECEKDNRYWSGAFFLRWMQLHDAEGKGRKVGIFTDSPMQPADLSLLPAREDAYRYAMAKGHWYLMHTYGDPKQKGYWNTLYDAMPADCRPRVLETETGRADGYHSPEDTVAYLSDREVALQGDLYIDAIMLYGMGVLYNDAKFVSNGALQAVENWRLAH